MKSNCTQRTTVFNVVFLICLTVSQKLIQIVESGFYFVAARKWMGSEIQSSELKRNSARPTLSEIPAQIYNAKQENSIRLTLRDRLKLYRMRIQRLAIKVTLVVILNIKKSVSSYTRQSQTSVSRLQLQQQFQTTTYGEMSQQKIGFVA